jgi:hypothetical protein
MKKGKKTLTNHILIALTIFLLTSCCTKTSDGNVNFSFKGEESSFAESDKYVYWVSYENNDNSKNTTWYISSFDKNGKKNFELTKTVYGNVFPLSDGRFFYASKNGDVTAYSESGKEIFSSHFNFDQNSNSNFMLNSKGELVINLISSPNNTTSYGVININGEKTTSPNLSNITACFTRVYPLGGYITEGFLSDYKWYIARLRDDFSVEWTYYAEEYKNVYIDDISKNGKILFHGDKGESGISYLSELDPSGRVTNVNHFKSYNLTAAYFQNKIVVVADTLKVINSDFSIDREFNALKFAHIKVLENTFFVYSQGSYSPGAQVIYDGYCIQYDVNMNQKFSKIFNSDSGFTQVSHDGILFYKK